MCNLLILILEHDLKGLASRVKTLNRGNESGICRDIRINKRPFKNKRALNLLYNLSVTLKEKLEQKLSILFRYSSVSYFVSAGAAG